MRLSLSDVSSCWVGLTPNRMPLSEDIAHAYDTELSRSLAIYTGKPSMHVTAFSDAPVWKLQPPPLGLAVGLRKSQHLTKNLFCTVT